MRSPPGRAARLVRAMPPTAIDPILSYRVPMRRAAVDTALFAHLAAEAQEKHGELPKLGTRVVPA